ncbi:ABC transporter permease [Agrobacterium rosae]|uniref:ABC transporter permease n=1 Tax=Agrobacterium rosae TaxID=1972867 RepID=A0AAW9FQV3_9HYPH|nr:ABC transporter permease [Agrobacterium rosae]MDX8305819.1 ABC transporter permease [Agrobacterium rosae]
MIYDILYSSIRIAAPLVLAAMGGLLTFQAGILNIALDGFMIIGAFTAIAVAHFTGSLTLGVVAGVGASIVCASLLAVFNLRFKAHVFIAGIAVTFIAYGITALLLQGLLGQEGVFTSSNISAFPSLHIPGIDRIPILGSLFDGHTFLVYVAYLSVPIVAWLLYRTRWGLRVRMIGEAEDAATAAGINADRVKFETMVASGFFCGLAGAYLSLGYVSLFAKQMTDDRGLIALAAIFFARGRPFATAFVAIVFGIASALSVRLPEVTKIAPQLLELIPYLVTILALLLVGLKTRRAQRANGVHGFEA